MIRSLPPKEKKNFRILEKSLFQKKVKIGAFSKKFGDVLEKKDVNFEEKVQFAKN